MDTTQIFDINKFPKGFGLIVFPISMSRIENAHSPKNCLDYLSSFNEKIQDPKVGAQFIYTEGLYMNMEEKAYETKNIYAQKMVSHMGGIKNLLAKNFQTFQIESAFCFESWFQMYLSHKDFLSVFKQARALYDEDPVFQKYIEEDTKAMERELSPQQINFLIEEHVFSYLLLNRQLKIQNDFVEGREEWVLIAYPGKPLLSEIYFYQKDILGINDNSNPYKGHYDVTEKKFYDFSKIVLESISL